MFWAGCVTLLLLQPGHINPAWLRVLHWHFTLLMSSPDSPLPALEEDPRRGKKEAAPLLLSALNVPPCPLPPPFSCSHLVPPLFLWEPYPGVPHLGVAPDHPNPSQLLVVRGGREGCYGDDGLPPGFPHPTCTVGEDHATSLPDKHGGIRNTNTPAGG